MSKELTQRIEACHSKAVEALQQNGYTLNNSKFTMSKQVPDTSLYAESWTKYDGEGQEWESVTFTISLNEFDLTPVLSWERVSHERVSNWDSLTGDASIDRAITNFDANL